MAIRQRGSRYQVDVKYHGQRTRAAADTLEDARQLEAEIRATLLKGGEWNTSTPRNGTAVTLGDLREHVRKHRWTGKRSGPGLIRNAELVCDLLGNDLPANRVDLAMLYKLRDRLAATGNSDSTINRKLASLSTMLSEAKAMGWIKDKPKIPTTRQPQGRIRMITEQEEHELLGWAGHFGHAPYQRLFLTALDTGARMGELRALQVRDLDLERGTVTFWLTKNDTSRTVPLYKRTIEAIKAQLMDHWGDAPPKATAPVWPEVTKRQINTVWDRCREQMGLTDDSQFVPHVMRHTCASRLVQAGVDLLVVKDWLGHLTLSTTLRYARLAPKNMFAARDAMEALRQD